MRWPYGLDIVPSGLGDLAKLAAWSLMNINEGDLITITVDLDMGLLHNIIPVIQLCVLSMSILFCTPSSFYF